MYYMMRASVAPVWDAGDELGGSRLGAKDLTFIICLGASPFTDARSRRQRGRGGKAGLPKLEVTGHISNVFSLESFPLKKV